VLGFPDDAGVDTEVIIRRFNLAVDFPREALAEAENISVRIPAADREKRKDFRRWLTVTVDGEKAQDFDDAVSIRKLPSGRLLLGVHIADVSHYVRLGSALDREAFRRGTSVYFPDLTLPMLPEKLSNDICSLRPRKTRLTVSVLLEVDKDGRVIRAEFHPSLIRTAERLTYTSVFRIFEGDEAEKQRYARLVPDLLLMRELAACLRSKREEEGSLNFDLLEPELIYKEGQLQAVAAFEANESHHLIEEFMVAANVAVARTLHEQSRPAVYRVHPPPGLADLEELREMLAHFGLFLPKPPEITSKSLQRILRQAEGKPAEKFINFQVLRALRLAVYSAENTGHYGLARKEYTHFTSPIRRYPDLIVHRALKTALEDRKMKIPALHSIALHSSEQERKADEAEKELTEWRIFRLLKAKLGEEFQGIIVDFTKAGVVVELGDYFVDGLIHYADLDGDYYRRRSKQTLAGRRTHRTFELGEKVRVILASVDPVGRRMSFVLSREEKGG
jgi:ribonuclease R